MPKLLQLNVSANRGSTGTIAEGIGKAAISRGWESVIAYGRFRNQSDSILVKFGSERDVYLHYAKNRLLDGEGLGSKRTTKQLLKFITEYRPDIIQLHNIHDHWLNYPILFNYLKDANIQVVWTFHDCWAFTGGCYHFENDNCFKWYTNGCSNGCCQKHFRSERNFNIKKEYFTALSERLNIVCVSNWMAKYVKQSFLDPSANIFTIKNGIDVGKIFTYSDTRKKRMILGVSNVWPEYKGLKDFVELRNLLSYDIEIILVGLDNKQINELPKGMKGISRTSNAEELANFYREASVFVNPTHNDTFPTVNLEALACGTPVVTYRTGGSPEAIDDNTGIVVEKGDVKELYKAIMTIIDNQSKYNSEACRKRAELNFNKDIQFNKYIDLYESILSK